MELAAIQLARFIAFFEIIDLDPRGRLHYPDVFSALIAKYHFQKFPEKYEEFDSQKGITFADGKWEKGNIDKIVIYSGGVSVDTRSSTGDSETFLHECLTWANTTFGVQYRQEIIKRKAYVSWITFYSDVPIVSGMSDPLSKLAERVTNKMEDVYGEKIGYEPTTVWIHHDQTTRKFSPANFSIQRRGDVPFIENKYFSEAPLPTELHLTLLKEFETDIFNKEKK